jgi:hypothetical protein
MAIKAAQILVAASHELPVSLRQIDWSMFSTYPAAIIAVTIEWQRASQEFNPIFDWEAAQELLLRPSVPS